jgi:hypothetical protein
MTANENNGSEPGRGEWPLDSLRELVRLEVEGKDLRGYSRQSVLAMKIAKRTGMSYPWIQREIELTQDPVRIG